MRYALSLLAVVLTGCAATISDQADTLKNLALAPAEPIAQQFSQSGTLFVGKFASVSAVNSTRTFVSDFHGEVRFTLYPNEKIECRWWAEGRITDETVYEGWDGFVEAFATLCAGRLQRDNSFEFQGAFIPSGATFAANEAEQTFSLRGTVQKNRITGELEIGSVFRNAVTITDVAEITDLGEGVRFEAVRSE